MKLRILFIMLCIAATSMAQQPAKMTKKFFPDPNVEINTPSFDMKGYVNSEQLIAYIEKTIEGKNFIQLSYIGQTQKGKNIPAIIFSKPTRMEKTKVMLSGRVHGDEPGGTEALLYLIDRLINDPSLSYLLDRLDIAIVPMVNIDGGEKLDRVTHNGLDLNRDMSKLATPEAVALRKFFNEFAPDVELDLHEYNPFRGDYLQFGSFGVSAPSDVMFLYSENPNYQKPLQDIVKNTYLPSLQKTLTDNYMTYCKYFTSNTQDGETYLSMGGASPRSTANAFGLSNTVTLLLEVRGTGMGKTEFKRRVYASYLVALNTLKFSVENATAIKTAIKEATELKTDIVVTQKNLEESRTMPFIDIQKNKLIDVELPVRDASNRENNIVRMRPEGYAILGEHKALADKLIQLGVIVDVLDTDRTIDVEAYTISSYRNGEEEFEGFHEQIVRAKVSKKTITLPKGTFMVTMDQRNANMAAVVLEPEADNGFVRYQVLPTHEGAELPIYRIMTTKEKTNK